MQPRLGLGVLRLASSSSSSSCLSRARALAGRRACREIAMTVAAREKGKVSLPHVERTAGEPRDESLHTVTISKITPLNPHIRLFQLTPISSGHSSASQHSQNPPAPPLTFKPGQWLDVHVPGIHRAGGFTITSPPSLLSPRHRDAPNPSQSSTRSRRDEATTTNNTVSPAHEIEHDDFRRPLNGQAGYLELAIQKSPKSPPAAWLWQPESEILGAEVKVRVGGSFVWPPQHLSLPKHFSTPLGVEANEEGGENVDEAQQKGVIKRVVFVAGGVGVNPLMSMVSSLVEEKERRNGKLGFEVIFLYGTKGPEQGGQMSSVLFLDRLRHAFDTLGKEGFLSVFLTGDTSPQNAQERSADGEMASADMKGLRAEKRRIAEADLLEALGPVEGRAGTVCYICGVPSMTDAFVEAAKKAEGMVDGNVLCEKWW